MSRKTALILIGTALLLVILGVLFFFWWNRDKVVEPDQPTFPSSGDTDFPPEDDGAGTAVLPPEIAPRLRLLSSEPVAGAVIGKRGGRLVARYVDVATGNVFEIGLSEGQPERLTNTTIPKVYEASWRPSGAGVVLRYLDDDEESVETFSGSIREQEGAVSERELAGTFLPRDITGLSVSPDGSKIFYLREENDQSVGVVSDMNGGGKKEVWRSPLREWNPLWIKSDTVALLSKPSLFAPGMLLYVNPSTGGVERVLADIGGFVALPSPTGALVAFNAATEGSFTFSIFEKASHESRPLSIRTVADKCAWNKTGVKLYCAVPKEIPNALYPDQWYQGLVRFSDDIWSVDAITGNTRPLLDPRIEARVELDITNLLVSDDESYLVFSDSDTQTLWSLRLTE